MYYLHSSFFGDSEVLKVFISLFHQNIYILILILLLKKYEVMLFAKKSIVNRSVISFEFVFCER